MGDMPSFNDEYRNSDDYCRKMNFINSLPGACKIPLYLKELAIMVDHVEPRAFKQTKKWNELDKEMAEYRKNNPDKNEYIGISIETPEILT